MSGSHCRICTRTCFATHATRAGRARGVGQPGDALGGQPGNRAAVPAGAGRLRRVGRLPVFRGRVRSHGRLHQQPGRRDQGAHSEVLHVASVPSMEAFLFDLFAVYLLLAGVCAAAVAVTISQSVGTKAHALVFGMRWDQGACPRFWHARRLRHPLVCQSYAST